MIAILVYVFAVVYSVSQMSTSVSASVAISEPSPFRILGGCYDEDTGHLETGETIDISGACAAATCLEDGSIQYFSCSPIALPHRRCHLSEINFWIPYPDCCPRLIC